MKKKIKSEIVFLSDATALLKKNSLIHLVKNFKDERIGLVSAKLNYIERKNGKSSGEGFYWKYESKLRKLESEVYSTVVASGALFAIRRELFTQIHPSSPDDFERPLITMENGFRVYYEDQAIVNEYLEEKNTTEIQRKIRIISREWFALFRHLRLINPFKYPTESYILISHKLIRWLLPLLSLSLFLSNIFLLEYNFFQVTLGIQVAIYLTGILGLISERKTKQSILLKLPAYWVSMNYAAFMGFVKFLLGKQQTTWNTNYGAKQ